MFDIIAIYDRPDDYPEYFVARWFKIDHPTHKLVLADTFEELIEKLGPSIQGKIFIPRSDTDHQNVIGSYM